MRKPKTDYTADQTGNRITVYDKHDDVICTIRSIDGEDIVEGDIYWKIARLIEMAPAMYNVLQKSPNFTPEQLQIIKYINS